jgi:ribosome maturation factor RimP
VSADVLTQIRDLVRPTLAQCGVELFDAQWDGRTEPRTLRLVIDSASGVSLDDCERVSNAVAVLLDVHDPIPEAYLLEVSSPGAERALRDLDDWRRHVGQRVNVRYRNGDAETVVEGNLVGVDGDVVEVETAARRGRVPHPREIAAGAARPEARGAVTRIALADVVAGRLAVEL